MRLAVALLALAGGFAYLGTVHAETPALTLSFGGEPRSFTSAELLARPSHAQPLAADAVALSAALG